MKRPLGLVALLYAAGLLLAEFFQPPLVLLFAVSLALAAIALLSGRARRLLIWPLVVLVGWTNLVSRTAVVSPHDLRRLLTDAPEEAVVRGRLRETPGERIYLRDGTETSRTLAELSVTAIRRGTNWQPAFGTILTTTPGKLPGAFFGGQEVEIGGVIAPPPGPPAEGLFDYRTFLRRQEIYFRLNAESSNDWRLLAPGRIAAPLSDRFLAWAKPALALGLPFEDESLRLEYALALADKTTMTDEVSEPFVRAATYHIFAVDGLRMAIIFGIFFALFRALRLPRVLCGLLLVPLIWFYVSLTGWPASAIRAAVMLTIVILGWALKRPSDLLNSLFAAALVILLWQPQQIFQAGFQLSFFVVLCILLMLPAFDRFIERLLRPDALLPDELRPRWQRLLHPPLRYVLDLWFTSLAAWLGSIPLAACYFHIVTPVSAPANVLAVPLCALVLTSNLISLLLAPWLPAGAEIFNHAGWFLMECIRVSSSWFADLPGACFYVAAPNLFTIGLYYILLLATVTGWLFKSKWRVWKISGAIALSLLWCVQWQREHSAAYVTVLPLNGASAVYCDAPGSRNDLLVDCGNSNAVAFVMKPFLHAQGVNRLPCLALTHGDLRRVGGAELLQTLMPVGQIAVGPAPFRSPAYRHIVESLQSTPERRRIVQQGDRLGEWTVLHPQPADRFAQADDNALVLRGEFFGTRVLLVSDLGRQGQYALLERTGDLRADIVVSGLPEQGEPLGDMLLEAIQPKLIVITDSEFPATKRARPDLRARLERRGIPVLYTRTAGAVTIAFQKDHWQASAMDGRVLTGASGASRERP